MRVPRAASSTLFNLIERPTNGVHLNLTIAQSTISGNRANVRGGGIYHADGNLSVDQSTISANTSSFGEGGGIFTDTNLTGSQSANIVNSTISGNSAGSPSSIQRGGGVYNADGLLVIEYATITNNFAASNTQFARDGNGSGVASRGVFPISGGPTTRTEVYSSIIAGNRTTGTTGTLGGDVYWVPDGNFSSNPFQSNGYNLIGTGNAQNRFNQQDDVTSITNPMLRPLGNNGGTTMTHAPLSGSPIIDAGNPLAMTGVDGVPAFDQRGAPFGRIVDSDNAGGPRIDIGAVEGQPIPAAVFGDFNSDNLIDAADYVVWRNGIGMTVMPYDGADGNGNGTIDQGDYGVWRANLGRTIVGTQVMPAVESAHSSYSSATSIAPVPDEVPTFTHSESGLEVQSKVVSLESTHLSPSAPRSPIDRMGHHFQQLNVASRHDSVLTACLHSQRIVNRRPYRDSNALLVDTISEETANEWNDMAIDAAFELYSSEHLNLSAR